MKIGLVARADNSGLGNLSWEFYRHLKEHVSRVVVIDNEAYRPFPERFDGAPVIKRSALHDWVMDGFLDDLDLVLAIETPYNWQLFAQAKARGIRTALVTMFECNEKPLQVYPDLLICPSQLDFDAFDGEPSERVIMPCPVACDRVPFRRRQRADVFVHHVGHGGIMGRTGTIELLRAIPLVKAQVEFVIRSQVPIEANWLKGDDRVRIQVGNVADYAGLWKDGDVYVTPSRQEMISMPLLEALSAGMPTLATAFDFHQGMLPESWLIPTSSKVRGRLFNRDLWFYTCSPEAIAAKIDEFAGRDVSKESEAAGEIARQYSWDRWKGAYIGALERLLRTGTIKP